MIKIFFYRPIYTLLLFCLPLVTIACSKSRSNPPLQEEEAVDDDNDSEPTTKNISVFYIGHSLSDYIPEMLKSLSDQDSKTAVHFGYQSIPGSPLRWNYDEIQRQNYAETPECFRFSFTNPSQGLASGKYTHLVLTESVPRHMGEYGIQETYTYVDRFYDYATKYNPDVRLYLYEVWHCIKSGSPTGCDYDKDSAPFRQRLTDDLPMWESVVNQFNEKHKPKHAMKLIPAGQAIARLYDEITSGNIPGLSSITDVFSDDIHGNNIIQYLVACVHYAVLLEEKPIGLSSSLSSCWGSPFSNPNISSSLATKLQEIAQNTVCAYNTKNSLCK